MGRAPRPREIRLIVAADLDRESVRRRFGAPTLVVPVTGLRDRGEASVEVWLRPPPDPPFATGRMPDEVLGASIALGLRSIDPRIAARRR
jgi:hypothetical protein